MGFHLVFIIILFIITTKHMCLDAENTTVCSEEERVALVKFKQSLQDDFGMLSSWVGNECFQWKGVYCDVATGSIVRLDLRGHNIWNSYYFPEPNPADEHPLDTEGYSPVGEDSYLIGDHLNSTLAELRNLKYLDLSGNDFQKSQIPQFIGSLKHLSYLNLSNAGFSGMIPSHFTNLSKLEVLDLSAPNQYLRVDDVEWVFSLSLLKHLNLSGVDLMRARNVDMVLYMIPSLIEFSLSHCSLTNAHLTPHLNLSTTLPNIRYLDLSKNFFEDQLPPFLQNMTSLEFFDLSYSDSNLPWNLANFVNLIPSISELHLSSCGLHNENLSPTNLNFSTHSNIRHLDLSWNSLEGRFPSFLTNMSSLRVLDLHHNFLNSSIPIMTNLVKLDISDNNFTNIEYVGLWRQCHLKELLVSSNYLVDKIVGPSTNISKCPQFGLEVLHLDHNQLNGLIPESLIRLTNLRVLDLSSNKLTNSIPNHLWRFKMLQVLDLSSNELNGRIPISLGQLSKITFLNVSSNYLEGMVIETHFANLIMLKYLDLSSNRNLTFNVSREWMPPFQLRTAQLGSCKVVDAFPLWVQTQRKLKKLVLSNTSISGPLPTWLKKMPIIPHLDLSHNNLSGPLTNLPFNGIRDEYRGSLLLQNNFFNESIPRSLCTRTGLEVFDISHNSLTGEIPTCLGHLRKLRAMILSYNGLSGVIPRSLGHNSLLTWLHLNGNNLSGELPEDLRNLDQLWILDLGNNELSGKIPEWISELTELMVLRLHKNKFSGRIPPSLCKNSCLQLLDVAHNSLKGPIPHCIEELSAMVERDYCRHYIYSKENVLQVLKGLELLYSSSLPFVVNMDLSSNKLVGQIPEELTTLSLLVGLNLSHNYLRGGIPRNIGNMKSLTSLDLSENILTGMIPQSMTRLDYLSFLNMSHNNLSGPIPEGSQLDTLDSSSYADNKKLCGSPLPNICTNHDLATTSSKNKFNATDDPNKLWFYLDIVSGFATGFLGVTGVLLFNKQRRRKFYMFVEVTMDKIYVVVAIRVAKMKRSREGA